MASGSVKGFYRQRKKNDAAAGGRAKKTSTAAGKGALSSSATLGSASAQPAAPVSYHGSLDHNDEYGEEEEEMLRQFDMDMRYGPCLGMTRLERWERASKMGLDPPKAVECLLLPFGGGGGGGGGGGDGADEVGLECLWEGRI